MIFKRCLSVLALAFLLSACGGGTQNDGVSGRDPGVLFRVNGIESDDFISTAVYTLDTTLLNFNPEECGTVDDPNYDNFAAISGGDYCDGTRNIVSPAISFQVSFINSTYETLPLSYTGVGFTIHIRDQGGVEVWNSDMAQYLANAYAKASPYVFTDSHAVNLGPQESFPSYRNGSFTTYIFYGDQNFADNGGGATDMETDLVVVDRANCELAYLDDDDGIANNGDNAPNQILDKPLCQNVPLPAGTYTATVDFNFNGSTESREVIIEIQP